MQIRGSELVCRSEMYQFDQKRQQIPIYIVVKQDSLRYRISPRPVIEHLIHDSATDGTRKLLPRCIAFYDNIYC